jgi:hypothetical protein
MKISVQDLALGQTVQFLSLLLHVNDYTMVSTAHERSYHQLTTFKSVFNIPDDKLVIIYDCFDNDRSDIGSDRCKPVSPYMKPLHLDLFGKNFSIDRNRKKPCVGIAIAKNEWELTQLINHGSDFTGFDHRRLYNYDIFEKIMKLVSSCGYDIITLSADTNLEEKIYLISQLCDCVIGYEGGMMHLAHCFDTPCIVLPWKPEYELDDECYNSQITRAEKTHLDRSTYFLSGPDEILGWLPEDLKKVVEQLKNKLGNNKLLNQGFTNKFPNIDAFLSSMETNQNTQGFIKERISTYTVGGYRELEIFKSVA